MTLPLFLLLQVFSLTFDDGAVAGVSGQSAFFDGLDSRITVEADSVPSPARHFAVDLWVCPAAFPKSPCPLACRVDNENPDGWSLWMDACGRVHFSVGCSGRWVSVDSPGAIPLREWSRISCFFRAGEGLRLAVDQKEVSYTPLELPSVNMKDFPLWIGRTPFRTPSFFENKSIPIYSSFDGALDELKIYSDKTSYGKIIAQKFVRPEAPEFEKRHLPSGPDRIDFGAWYIPLKYYKAWDERWRGASPDVVVGFGPENPSKVVFWKGISYAPCFVTEKDNWMCNEFLERKKVTGWGCPESMSDKHADFSSVSILENTPARAVVLWRNAPVGVNQMLPYQSPETGWGDRSEEIYIFYPDGTGLRKMDFWSEHTDTWYEWCQSLQVLHPDQRPEDVLDPAKIMSVAAMDGRSATYGWEYGVEKSNSAPSIEGANIQVTYLRSEWNPFLILDDRDGINENGKNGPEIQRYVGQWSDFSAFPWRNHWPVNQDFVIGRHAAVADAPAHTYTATQYNAPYFKSENRMTKLMLCGCTQGDASDLLPLAKSWLRAPEMLIGGGNAVLYDVTQRAYVLKETADEGSLDLYVNASCDHPACGVCLIVENWKGGLPQSVSSDSIPVSFKAGLRYGCDGNALVLWMDVRSDVPLKLSVR